MAASITGIWNHLSNTHALNSAQPVAVDDATGSGSDSGSSDSSTISANDFLTLLVTEMQNQDPTADTDPNEYINQLVQVNSLEQLISINQTLTADSSATPSGDAVGSTGVEKAASISGGPGPAAGVTAPISQHASPSSAVQRLAPGSLAIPKTNPAAQRVAQALSGQ
jgi:flagellar basal-body rod modification protein FlgD